MVLMWKQGPRVLTAGSMMVRRDKRLQLRGNNLVISQLEVDDGVADAEAVEVVVLDARSH